MGAGAGPGAGAVEGAGVGISLDRPDLPPQDSALDLEHRGVVMLAQQQAPQAQGDRPILFDEDNKVRVQADEMGEQRRQLRGKLETQTHTRRHTLMLVSIMVSLLLLCGLMNLISVSVLVVLLVAISDV